MSITQPTGQYAEQMLGSNGWPLVDEDTLHERARQYTQALSQVTEVLAACRHEHIGIFDVGVWSGGAAGVAGGELGTRIDELTTLQHHLAHVITWHRDTASSVDAAKSEIGDNVELAHRQIAELENDSRLEEAERADAIKAVVLATHTANVGVVSDTAERILASKDATPQPNAVTKLLGQKALPSDDESPDDAPARPAAPVSWAPIVPATLLPSASAAGVGPRLTPQLSPLPATEPAPQAVSSPGHAGAAAIATSGATGHGAPGLKPAAAHATAPNPHGGVRSKAVASVRPSSGDAAGAPVADTAMPGMPMAAAAPTTPAAPGGAASAGSGSRAPIGQSSSRKPSAVRPAAAAKPSPRPRAAARAESADDNRAPDGVAAPVVSVSLARAARDAIADATVGNAGADALRMARHVAAALNAPVAGCTPDMGFYWVTAVTTDGKIVVANSYGLAYIPDGVQLPAEVHMASADESIHVAERASWATYPMLAVQAWARQHDTELRAVIGTKEQLANSDPGVATIVLTADDIPDSGEMVGRTRLEVVAPEAAERLAATPERNLLDLIPPAPVGNPPADQRAMLWLTVMQPLASKLAGRQAAHLQAMHAYAVHTEQALLHQAHNAADPVAQRDAVADWLYWHHLASRLDDTLAAAA